MRSVVVVLPASMCAMIPMLRVLASWAALVAISDSSLSLVRVRVVRGWPGVPPAGAGGRGVAPAGGRLPAGGGESLVRLGPLVRVLAALGRRTRAVAGVGQLVHV